VFKKKWKRVGKKRRGRKRRRRENMEEQEGEIE
jgi:hypothetical protein